MVFFVLFSMATHAPAGIVGQFTASANSYISVPSTSELKTFSALTLETWIKPGGGGEWALLMGKQLNSADINPWYSFRLLVASANSSDDGFPNPISFNIAPATTGGEVGVVSTTEIQNNTWTHVAGVYDGATMKIYINGLLENTATQTGALKSSDNPLYIGKAPWTNYNNYNGAMAELSIWNVARTQAELQYSMSHSLTGNELGLVLYLPLNDAIGSLTAADGSLLNNDGAVHNGAGFVVDATAPVMIVPEPSAFVLLGVGLGGLAFLRKRSTKARGDRRARGDR